MSRVATANIVITLEYDVEQTFEDDMSIHDMRDNWSEFINLKGTRRFFSQTFHLNSLNLLLSLQNQSLLHLQKLLHLLQAQQFQVQYLEP